MDSTTNGRNQSRYLYKIKVLKFMKNESKNIKQQRGVLNRGNTSLQFRRILFICPA